MNKKFYITTSIPYVNASPHIGQALEFTQADIIARYHRLAGDNTYFLTGTDENAHKNYLVAQEKNISVEKFVGKYSREFTQLTKKLLISNNDFIRTTDQKKHWPGVFQIWEKAVQNNDIYKKKYTGFYCLGCEAFVTKKDLKKGLCPVHQKKPEKISEQNYFFRLSKYQKKLKNLIFTNKLLIIPKNRKKEVLNFISAGLEDLSVSRDRKRVPWGIPVPNDPSQTIYVWYDALANYISALGYGTKNNKLFKKYWPADLHLVGKDIIRFHAIYWPAMLLSAGIKPPKKILVHGFYTVNGQKMSKTLGNVINPLDIIKKYGAETLRYYLISRGALFSDADFSFKELETIYNADLANGLGNLVSRVSSLTKQAGLEIEEETSKLTLKDSLDAKEHEAYHQAFEEFRLNDALEFIWKLIKQTDQFIDQNKPWVQLKKEKLAPIEIRKLSGVLFHLVDEIYVIAVLLEPFLPKTAEKIKRQFSAKKIKPEKPLFPRLN